MDIQIVKEIRSPPQAELQTRPSTDALSSMAQPVPAELCPADHPRTACMQHRRNIGRHSMCMFELQGSKGWCLLQRGITLRFYRLFGQAVQR